MRVVSFVKPTNLILSYLAGYRRNGRPRPAESDGDGWVIHMVVRWLRCISSYNLQGCNSERDLGDKGHVDAHE